MCAWEGGGRLERYSSRSDWKSTNTELPPPIPELFFMKPYILYVSASDQIFLLSVDDFSKFLPICDLYFWQISAPTPSKSTFQNLL